MLNYLFDTSDFSPRWWCGIGWQEEPVWGWLHIISDLAMWGAYLAIPCLLAYFLRRRPDIPFPRILWLFVAFIFACGTVHLVEATLFWYPVYRVSGLVKLVTALVSWATVYALIHVVPRLLGFRSPTELETMVRQRTIELEELTTQLQQEVRQNLKIAVALEEQEQRLRMALQAGKMGTWEWDLKTNKLTMDQVELELTALPDAPGELDAVEFFNRVHSDDIPGLQHAIQQAIDGHQQYIHEFRFSPEPGVMRWLAGRGEVEYDDQGDPVRMRGINFDTTVAHLVHEQSRQSEAFLRSLLESSADCIQVLDLQGRLLSINQAGLAALEIEDCDTIKERVWASLWPPEYAAGAQKTLETAQAGKVARFQGLSLTPSGQQKSWDVIISPIGNPEEGFQRLLCISRDMTEIQDISRARQETEGRFHTLADNMDHLAWMSDAAGHVFWFNQRWLEFVGKSTVEMQQADWLSLIHSDHRARVSQKFQTHLQQEHDWEDTFPLRGKEGVYRWFLCRSRPIRDAQGKIVRWFGTYTDITERLAADQALARAHAQLKSIVDAAPDAIVTIDEHGHILTANSAIEQIFGYLPQEVVGHSIDMLVPLTSLTVVTPRGSRQLPRERFIVGKGHECTGSRKDGSEIPLEVSSSRSHAGQRLFYAWVIRDISARKRTEAELRIRNRAIECATNSIVITDAHSPDNKIVYVNPAFEELTGYTAREAVGKTCSFLEGPDSATEQSQEFQGAFQARQECHVTILNYRKDGSTFWNDLHLSPVQDESGHVTHFISIQSNVTERIEYEQQLHDAQLQADSANRAKSEFVANMSHEIRTPLTAILGCADVLFRQLEASDPREVVRMIRDQGNLLLGILNDVLDLSKIEAGKLEITIEDCELLGILSGVHFLMHPQAQEKGIELRIQYLTNIPERVRTDPLRMRQILLNLVSNAIKFTKTGSVEIQVSCREESDSALLQIAVQDTGVGIPADRLQSIFEAFSQVKNPHTSHVPGTGLGLTICQKLARMLDCTLIVTSTEGVGSRFVVELPLGKIETPRQRDPVDVIRRAALHDSQMSVEISIPCRVLVAEDTRGIQFMITRMLNDVVTSLLVVENGEAAVNEMIAAQERGTPYDIILMDMQMPVMTGFEATRKLRELGYTLPIIALTAGAMAGDKENCIAAGCTDYLPKPIDRLKLLDLLQDYTDAKMRSAATEQIDRG